MPFLAVVFVAALGSGLVPGAGALPGAGTAEAQVRLGEPRPSAGEVAARRRAAESHPDDPAAWAEYARALIAQENIEDRLRARRALRRAIELAPRDPDYRLALADLYYRQGYFTLARRQLQSALRVDDDNAPAYARLGRLAMRDWIKFQRRGSLEAARGYWQDAARRSPADAEPWLGLGVIALLERDPLGAIAAGQKVLSSARDPGALHRGEAWLLVGAGSYGAGRAEAADSAFERALPLLAGPVRDHLTNIGPAASDADTAAFRRLADSGARERFLAAFWKGRDPDLTTAVNEARLEFLARGTLAYFLFFDHRRRTWDERAWYLVRYGPPEQVEYNPILVTGEYGAGAASNVNRLVWKYPSIGVQVYLEDRYLNEFYDIPISTSQVVDFVPDPDTLARRVADGELAVAGRGVVRTTLPAHARLEGTPAMALFRRVEGFDPRTSTGPLAGSSSAAMAASGRALAEGRVEAYLAVHDAAGGGDLTSEAVVYEDSTFREVARARTRQFAWCQSDSVQVVQFNFDLPPGRYVVGLAARDSSRRATGAWRVPVEVPDYVAGRLDVSDLELACGIDPGQRATPFAKISYAVYPNPLRQVPRDQPFGFYFEVYNLVPDEAGRAQVALEYTVRSTRPDRRPFFVKAVNPRRHDPVLDVERRDDVPGRARFQYVTANLAGQEPGPYRVDVAVTDPASGFRVERSIEFELVE